MTDPKATLKAGFAALGPVEWADISGSLSDFLKKTFTHAEQLANSCPLPQTDEDTFAKNPSSYRAKAPVDTLVEPHATTLDRRHEDLQKIWGKPINKAKDNPLHVWMYKTAGTDKRGAWFARRSIHRGLPFSKWKTAMQREFLTSLKVQEGPGSGAVRGIAGDRRIESETVDGVGSAEVWLVSSAFPGPTSPRDFVTLLCMSDSCLTEASVAEGAESKDPPRHFAVVSVPVQHPDAGQRAGMVRGYYESVEIAREIPGTGEDAESNLVEWIMITRSDPGGGIPRFMVERGTPGSIVADVPKWIEWAITKGGDAEGDDQQREKELKEANTQASTEGPNGAAASVAAGGGPVDHAHTNGADGDQGGSSLLGSLTTAVGATAATVASFLPESVVGPQDASYAADEDEDDEDEDDASSTSSSSTDGTYESADEYGRGLPSQQFDAAGQPIPQNSHEKELLKLDAKRSALDEKMARTRSDDLAAAPQDEAPEARRKQQDKLDRERAKAEEKYAKEMRRLEAKRAKEERKAGEARRKEERKAEQRARKAREKDAALKAQGERDTVRERLRAAEAEMVSLRAQVEQLHRENGMLAQRLGSAPGAAAGGESSADIVARIRQEAAASPRSRADSRASGRSGGHRSVLSTESLPAYAPGSAEQQQQQPAS